MGLKSRKAPTRPTVVFEGVDRGRPLRVVVVPKEPLGRPVTDATMGKDPPPREWHEVCAMVVERGDYDAAGKARWIEIDYNNWRGGLNALEGYLCYELARALGKLPDWAVPQ